MDNNKKMLEKKINSGEDNLVRLENSSEKIGLFRTDLEKFDFEEY